MRTAFAVVTATLLLVEIALTRLFSGTIGYYFAFMSISVAMLGLGAGSLWVTLRGPVKGPPERRAALASLGLSASLAASTLFYLAYYPAMGREGLDGQVAHALVFFALFVPFLFGGVIVSVIFEAHKAIFGRLYAIDLGAAAIGCVVAVFLLDHVPAPRALLVIAAFAGLAAPLFFLATGARRAAGLALGGLAIASGVLTFALSGSSLFSARVIRNQVLPPLVADRWNDFSRVIVKPGPFFTWGLSDTYTAHRDPQFDLLIEGVAGTQIQQCDGDVSKMDFFSYDAASLAHVIRPQGSALILGVGAGFDILMAKYFHKAPIVGVEVNPLVGDIVNGQFGAYTSRPYFMPGIDVHFENARTYVKRDQNRYDLVTVTWVDSGAATGAGAFALTENYLYTVDAFRDYLARLKDDGVLAFMRSRYSPIFDAIKGIGIAVEAMRGLGIQDPSRNIVVTAVASPHFGYRELVYVMLKRQPFTDAEIATIDETRARLHFKDLYTPGHPTADGPIRDLIVSTDRAAVYASFPFDMEPNTDDRPFYFFLRSGNGREAGRDVKVLRQSIITIVALIALFLVAPLVVLVRRGLHAAPSEKSSASAPSSPSGTALSAPGSSGASSISATLRQLVGPTAYFGLLGLGFMLVEMKLLQQSVLVVGNPTLSLAAVLASLLLSTGIGALLSERVAASKLSAWAFAPLLGMLVLALLTSAVVADWLVGFPIVIRTAGVALSIAPLGLLLGLPLPLGMSRLRAAPGLTAWCWGINGMLGVAGSAVAIYVGIYYGLAVSFLLGVGCYIGAGLLYRFALAPANVASTESAPTVAAGAPAVEG